MTRINVVPPRDLHPKHLLAEYRELPRVFSYVEALTKKGYEPSDIDIPTDYVLGEGHVKFFTNKLQYLAKRQGAIILQLGSLGYNLMHTQSLAVTYGHLPLHWWFDYQPTASALKLNASRLHERLPSFYPV